MRMIKFFLLITCLMAGLSLNACGRRGELTMPDAQTASNFVTPQQVR